MPVILATHGIYMASNSSTELEGVVMGLVVLINTTFLVYKQLSRYNNSKNEL